MNTLELKKKIIQQINHLNEAELEKVYSQLLETLKSSKNYKLSDEENEAINQALKVSDEGQIYLGKEVIAEAKEKFPSLKFK